MNSSELTTITIDTAPERAFSMCDGHIFPAKIELPDGVTHDFGSQEDIPNLSPVTDIEVILFEDGKSRNIQLPQIVTSGIAKFLRESQWDEDSNCQTFAWTALNLTVEDLFKRGREPLENREEVLKTGDLLLVGYETPHPRFTFLSVFEGLHWSLYLDRGLTINVTGQNGILAGTPLKEFDRIYPEADTYYFPDLRL
ncbi:MAG: hypothetical protein ACXWLH_01335 [Candidatus Saccharimonadales bacterium]